MSEYDNTNSGVMFRPFQEQKLVLQGNVNINGKETRIIGIMDTLTKGGDPVMVIYERKCVLFKNEKKKEKSPDYSGPIDETDLRMAGWKGNKDGKPYLSIRVSKQENQDSEPSQSDDPLDGDIDDEIPF